MRRLQHRRLPRRRLRRRRVDAGEALSAYGGSRLLVDGDLPLQQHEVVAVQRRRRAARLAARGLARAVRLLGGGAGAVHCGAVCRCAPARGLLEVRGRSARRREGVPS